MTSSSRSTTPISSPCLPLFLRPSHEKPVTLSLTELVATSTRTTLSRLLRPRTVLVAIISGCIITGYLFILPVTGSRYSKSPDIVRSPPHSLFSDRNHLVVVAGHAIWKGGPMLGEIDEEWTLEPYQRGHNESLTWIEHIHKGIQVASGSDSILIFSGGETRPSSGPRTEAQSYWNLAEALGLLTPNMFPVTTTEIYARDSLENLLFSICRFKEFTGNYPEFVTVIGYEFKRRRFSEIHRTAILFPKERFTYIGIDPHNETLVEQMSEFELKNSLAPFEKDPYACFDKILVEKRISRGWSQRGSGGYANSCEELKSLLDYCGVQSDGTVKIFHEPLPWTQ